jgi:hypothetical protein
MTHARATAPAQDPLASLLALPTVVAAVDTARTAVDTLLGHRALRRESAQVTAESFLRGVRASAALAGVDWPLDRVRAGANAEDGEGAVIGGALRVAGEFGSLTPVWQRAPAQALARMHMLLAADVLEAAALGRPRSDGVDGADEAAVWRQRTGRPDAVPDPVLAELGPPPAPDEVSVRLAALGRLLTGRHQSPAVLVAAVTHGELLALQPFAWGNGLIARAAERLVIVARGLDPKSVSAPEVGHAELGPDRYLTAARAYLTGTPDGVAAWVAHCAEAIALGARESLAVCEALRR